MHCASLNNWLAVFAMVSAFKSLIEAQKIDRSVMKREVIQFLEQNSLDKIVQKVLRVRKSINTKKRKNSREIYFF